MRSKMVGLTTVAVLTFSGLALAEDMVMPDAVTAPVAVSPEQAKVLVNVGNKICPVSGKEIGSDGMAATTVEYNGKEYNLCCPGCKDQFLADPEKFSKIAEAEGVANVVETEKNIEK